MTRGKIIILAAIVILAFFMRTIGLSKVPLYGDELTMVYDTYSVLKTGKDQLGNPWPLTFKMGEGRPAGYVYASIPFVALFGPNTWGVRGLSILSGVGIVLLLFYLSKKLFSEKVGLVASLFAAISPWNLSLSRGGFEAHFALFLALLGITLFLYANKKTFYYLISGLSLGLTFFTYPTYKLVLPVFLIIILGFSLSYNRIKIKTLNKKLIGGILIISVLFIASIAQTLFNQSEKRFFNINLFSDNYIKQQLVQEINFERSISTLPSPLPNLFHNKPVKYGQLLLGGYLDNLSFDYLFLKGDGNPRHNMTGIGEMYWVDMAFIAFGIIILGSRSRKKLLFLIAWILVAPLATVLISTPHALRNLFMLPPLILLSAVGANNILEKLKDSHWIKIIAIGLVGILLFEFLMVVDNLYFVSPNKFAQFWSYSAKKAVDEINKRGSNYDYIFLSNRIDNAEFAYQVYDKIDPVQAISQKDFPTEVNGIRFKKFGKVYIGTIPEEKNGDFFNGLATDKILYLANIDEMGGLKDYEVFDSPDQAHGFIVKSF